MTDAYILESVKDYCQVPQEADIYNSELCGHINTAFFTLFQLGCSARPFTVTGEQTSWEDFTDNPYAVFKKMYTDERFRNYNLVWLIGEDKKCDYLKKEVFKSYPNVKIVSKSSLKGLYYLLISS